MFTLSDICSIAIQIERNGHEAYRDAAKRSKVPEVAQILEMLADDEQKHMRWFEEMGRYGAADIQDPKIEQIGRGLLQEMMAAQTFSLDQDRMAATETPQTMLQQSIEFERDTIFFYEMLSGFVDDIETREQLEQIIAEERSHVDKLKLVLALQDDLDLQVS